MNWLESLKQRWFRGGNSTVPPGAQEQVEREVYSSPNEASQRSTLPDEQQDDVIDRPSHPDSP